MSESQIIKCLIKKSITKISNGKACNIKKRQRTFKRIIQVQNIKTSKLKNVAKCRKLYKMSNANKR